MNVRRQAIRRRRVWFQLAFVFLFLGLLAWLSLGGNLGLPAEPTLLALAFGLFALLLLESAVFRHRLGAR